MNSPKLLGLLVVGLFCLTHLARASELVRISCAATNDSYGETMEITLAGEQISATFADKVDQPTEENGYPTSNGAFTLDQGGLGCGNGVYLTIDPGLLSGSITDGTATVTIPGNYGCGGDTITYNCKRDI